MNDQLPRWKISYRQAGQTEIKSITVPGGSLISAYKDATRQLWAQGFPVHVFRIAETDEPVTYALDATPLVDTTPCEREPI